MYKINSVDILFHKKYKLLKIILIGDEEDDLYTLQNTYFGRGFRTEHLMTIGADFSALETEIDGIPITFQVWSTQLKVNVSTRFINGALGAICVFDINKKNSFLAVSGLIERIWKNSGKGIVPIVLLGLDKAKRNLGSLSRDQIDQYVSQLTSKIKKKGINISYFEGSVDTGEGIKEAITELGREIMKFLERPLYQINETEEIHVDQYSPFCHICKFQINSNDVISMCHHCGNKFHRIHLYAYVQSAGVCAVCKENLTLTEI